MTVDISPFLASVLISSTIILTLAFITVGLVKRMSSSERNLIWCLVFFSLSLLPILTLVVPKYQLPVPVFDFMAPLQIDITMFWDQKTKFIDNSLSGIKGTGIAAYLTKFKEMGTGLTLSIVYLIIMPMFLFYLGYIYLQISQSLKSLSEIYDPAILGQVLSIRQSLGIKRKIKVLQSDHDKTPWTWGIFQSKIILPNTFSEWSSEEQQNALVHELSHIHRFDLSTFIITRICCCLYWFHPLVWIGYWKMVLESEKACDDLVLLGGSKGSLYASQLMEVANSIYRGSIQQPIVAGMARPSSLSHRVQSILDGDIRRDGISKQVVTLSTSITLVLSLTLVACQTITEQPGGEITTDTPTMSDTVYKRLLEAEEYIENRQYDEGLAILHSLESSSNLSSNERAQIFNYFAHTYFNLEKYQDSLHYYEKVDAEPVKTKELTLNTLYTMAQLYFFLENYPEAILAINHWFKLVPEPTLSAYMLLAQAYYLLENYEESMVPAKKAYDLIKSQGNNPNNIHLGLMMSLYGKLEDNENIKNINRELNELYLYPIQNENYSEYLPVSKIRPIYPSDALRDHVEGYVVVEFVVTSNGTTDEIKIVESVPSGVFDEAAIEVAKKFRYQPRHENGITVDVPGVQNKITWEIDEDKRGEINFILVN